MRSDGEAVKKLDQAPFPSLHHCLAMSHIFLLDTGALKTTGGKAEVPSLDKEGWLRPLRKCREASLAGADGVVGSSHRLSEVERTTPAAPPKERDHLLDGAASPPLPRRGLRLSPPVVPETGIRFRISNASVVHRSTAASCMLH